MLDPEYSLHFTKMNETTVNNSKAVSYNTLNSSSSSKKKNYLFSGPPRFSEAKNANNYSLSSINHLVSDNVKRPLEIESRSLSISSTRGLPEAAQKTQGFNSNRDYFLSIPTIKTLPDQQPSYKPADTQLPTENAVKSATNQLTLLKSQSNPFLKLNASSVNSI